MESAIAVFLETFSFTGQSAMIVVAVFFAVEGVLKPIVKLLPYNSIHTPIIVSLAMISSSAFQVGLFGWSIENLLQGIILGAVASGIYTYLDKRRASDGRHGVQA